ncbi:hypothetical protein LTR17_001232 [Elasticomyces elasticus]|nr:hypothetical protein LTR17_001232 [Elasticomyces elasticus]
MSASHSTSSLAVNANMTNEPEMSSSVSETKTTSTDDQVRETVLAQRLKHHISQLHRETKALEEVKHRVHHKTMTTQQELRPLEIRPIAEDAKQRELYVLARQRMVMEEEAIRQAEHELDRKFILFAFAGFMCFLAVVGKEIASCYWGETVLGDAVPLVALGGIAGMMVWVEGLEKKETSDSLHHAYVRGSTDFGPRTRWTLPLGRHGDKSLSMRGVLCDYGDDLGMMV